MLANQAVHLTIQTISGNSGVYFGNQNVSVGVSSHSKSNEAIGSIGSHNLVQRNLNLISDPDVIDTPIDDRDIHMYAPTYRNSAPNVLNTRVDQIECGTFNQNAGLFIGETTITGFDSHEKQNMGHGQTFGNVNQAQGNLNIIYDPDNIDGVMDDRDVKSGMFVSSNAPPILTSANRE